MAGNWKTWNRRWHANIGMALAITMGLIALSCPFIAHKSDGALGDILKDIHYGKFLPSHLRWIWIDSQGLGLAFLVVSGWLMHKKTARKATNVAGDDPTAAGSSITFVGLGKRDVLDAGASLAESHGLRSFRCEASGFARLRLEQERWIVFTAGGHHDCRAAVGAVLAALGRAPAGKAKRLEFTIDPTLDAGLAQRLTQAMTRTGARRCETSPAPSISSPTPVPSSAEPLPA